MTVPGVSRSPIESPASQDSARRLAAVVLDWYALNARHLVFRRTADPWAVLVSEVMAQQTQAERAARAWEAFIERYPTPARFAEVAPAEAIRAWRGLGYNRRAIALRAAAIRIVERHGGRVPDDLDALQALPGIGPYTARAVAAIAFGRRVAALDTNITRVLDRALGGLPASTRHRQAFADTLVPLDRAADWTHALMDIGATFCRARETRCHACPLRQGCSAAQGDVRVAPTGPATPVRDAVPFRATTRWLRGRILDRLRDAPDGAWTTFDGSMGDHGARATRRAL
ncbi:MAG TPA: A/G-specific adenine glycosylase, partial [Candidatus Binatia bacterium]|nr:A/G-specific adenine glycosylase [Candidatus Binatia bacterium]